MNRQRALELLDRSKPELQARFGVTRLALFGSTARDTATSGSDVDILVAFDGPATSKRCFGVQFYLEDLLGCARSIWLPKRPCARSCAPVSIGSESISESKTSREDAMAGRNIADRVSAVEAIKRLHEEDLFPEICTNTYPLETKKRWLRCQVTYCNYGH